MFGRKKKPKTLIDVLSANLMKAKSRPPAPAVRSLDHMLPSTHMTNRGQN